MPSATDIANALGGYPSGSVTRRFRYYLSDKTGAAGAEITRAVRAASVDLDNTRAILRTAKFTLDPHRTAQIIDPASSVIRADEQILIAGVRYAASWGVFRLTAPMENESPGGTLLWDITANDLSSYLYQASLPTPYTVPAGTNYVAAIATVLDLLGLQHSSPPLPAIAAVLPVAITFPPATATYGDVVAKLAWDINYYAPWPDVTGNFAIAPRLDPFVQSAAVQYSTLNPPLMIRPTLGRKLDSARYYNQVVVLIDDPTRAPAYSLRKNNDPSSPISIASLGATDNQEISGGSVVDLTTAQAIADFELRFYAARAKQATLNTALDFRREGHETYDVWAGSEVGSHWLTLGWKADLKPNGTMVHTLGNAASVAVSS